MYIYFLASQIGNTNIFCPALGYDDTKSDTINEIKAVKNGGQYKFPINEETSDKISDK